MIKPNLVGMKTHLEIFANFFCERENVQNYGYFEKKNLAQS